LELPRAIFTTSEFVEIGKDWAITTDISKGTTDSNALSAFLEWAHRY